MPCVSKSHQLQQPTFHRVGCDAGKLQHDHPAKTVPNGSHFAGQIQVASSSHGRLVSGKQDALTSGSVGEEVVDERTTDLQGVVGR